MSEIMEIKTATMTEKGQICIPQEARALAGFKKGAKIGIIVYADRVELRPMKQMSNAMAAMLSSEKALAKNWMSKEDEKAWKNL